MARPSDPIKLRDGGTRGPRAGVSKRLAQRELARRYVDLRQRIDESGDPDLLALIEERDMLKMNYEMGREIKGEWAVLARKIAPESTGCDCNVCAISRALDKAAGE